MITRCIVCGVRTLATRCPAHQRKPVTYRERQRRGVAVRRHRAEHGEWCPGWDVPAHPVVPPNLLTADHWDAVAGGGAEDGELEVLCRECNSRKGARS